MKRQPWTDDALTALAGWWAEGKSSSDIQLLLETEVGFYTTRNAVMGKLRRLGKLGHGRKRGRLSSEAYKLKRGTMFVGAA